MKSFFNFCLLFLLCASSFSWGATLCENISSEEGVEKIIPDLKNVQYLEFFASWCGECKLKIQRNLKDGKTADRIYVALWDDIDASNRVMKHFDVKSKCFFDAKGLLAKRFKVSKVPTTIESRFK